MVPSIILRQLGQMRRRERLLALVWGVVRWLVLAGLLLSLCCLTDWVVDRYQDTPMALRWGLLLGQLLFSAALLTWLVLRPMVRRLSDGQMALQVEDTHPHLKQRLISTIQLNQPGANTQGMSPDLIGAVTQEAEQQVRQIDFVGVLDHRRLKWSSAILVPLLLVVGLLFALFSETLPILLARQFLADREIPRSVQLVTLTQEVWPSGEQVLLRFKVTADAIAEDSRGKVYLDREGEPGEKYDLEFDSHIDDKTAIFTATVPASTVNFTYRARLQDGRTLEPGKVTYVPRPEVVSREAWELLPEYVGTRADGSLYARQMEKGNIRGWEDSSARVVIGTQKPIRHGVVELLGRSHVGGVEQVHRRIPLIVLGDGQEAEAIFDLRRAETAYRVLVFDEYGFGNRHTPQRGIEVLQAPLPRVDLKPERLTDDTDIDYEEMPLPVGKVMNVRLAYTCESPLGLAKARLGIRVNDGPMIRTEPLSEYRETTESGPFDFQRCVFWSSGLDDPVNFHAVPSRKPDEEPSRLRGGGRFDRDLQKLVKEGADPRLGEVLSTLSVLAGVSEPSACIWNTLGGAQDQQAMFKAYRNHLELRVGDKVEIYMEVCDQKPGRSNEEWGRTTTPRIKFVVTGKDFFAWLQDKRKQEEKIQKLRSGQSGIFD